MHSQSGGTMKILNRLTRQRGIAIPIIAIMMLTMIAMIGLALDTGSAFLNNTRLQNAVDSATISAAVKLNIDPDRNTADATAAGIAIFTQYISESNKSYIANHYKPGNLVFEFSRTYYPDFVPGSAEPAFVRVTYDSGTNFKTYFMNILGVDSVTLDVTAVAGPVGLNCNVLPIAICATMNNNDPTDPNPIDSDCSDDGCFGYTFFEPMDLIWKADCKPSGCTEDDNLDAGNFGLINLPGLKGGNDIREAFAEGVNSCVSDTVDTKPGLTWGAVKQGIADRINGDTKTGSYTSTSGNFQNYLAATPDNLPPEGTGINLYREQPVIIADCRGKQNGSSNLPILSLGCVFITEPASNEGADKVLNAELTKECPGSGLIDALNPSLIGPYKIILYKDERRTDS